MWFLTQTWPLPLPTSEQIYRKLRADFDRRKVVIVHILDQSEHEQTFTFARPNKGSKRGMNNCFVSNGKWTYERDSLGFVDRKAKPDDLVQIALPGLESFYASKAKVVGKRPVRLLTVSGKQVFDLQLTIDGNFVHLFLDPHTLNLEGSLMGDEKRLEFLSMTPYVFEKDPKISPETFDIRHLRG